ncbi:PIH1 domain-containing protein 1, partial [Operophtera brumata]
MAQGVNTIPCPRDVTNEQLMKILNSSDPSSYRVPMSIGEGRTESDKSGSPCTVYDVAINSEFFKKVEKDVLFQTFFLTVVFEGLQDKYQCELDVQKSTILKNRKSIGTLQSHRIQIRDIKTTESALKAPLIEEIGEKPAPVTKKPELVYRMRREPPIGEIEYLIAEFKIPASVEFKDLNLEVGEDRLVLDSKGMFEMIDFFLPCSVDQEYIDAQLNRNND